MSNAERRFRFLQQYEKLVQQFVTVSSEIQSNLAERGTLAAQMKELADGYSLIRTDVNYLDFDETDRLLDEAERKLDQQDEVFAAVERQYNAGAAHYEQLQEALSQIQAKQQALVEAEVTASIADLQSELLQDLRAIFGRYGLNPTSDEILH